MPWQRVHVTTAMAGEAPRWRQVRAMTATATAMAGEAPRGDDKRHDNNGNGLFRGRAITAVAAEATVVATTVTTAMAEEEQY